MYRGLSFNLTRVAAEGAPGTSSHDCYDRSGGRRGKPQPGAVHINVQYLFHSSITACVCVFVFVYGGVCMLQLTVAFAV